MGCPHAVPVDFQNMLGGVYPPSRDISGAISPRKLQHPPVTKTVQINSYFVASTITRKVRAQSRTQNRHIRNSRRI
jgi:hypothetical protein